MATPTPSRQTALQTFQARALLPTHLGSEDISTQLTREVRERSFFMSKVQDVEILQKFRDETEAVLRGDYDEGTAEGRIWTWLQERGYQAPIGKEGGLEDLSSNDRITVVLRTNIDMARGYSTWLHQMQVRDHYPAQRLVRKSERIEPRPWPERWQAAFNATDETPGASEKEMVALIDHPIWTQLSRFSNPYPPFDFNSGMGVTPVSRADADRLGILPKPTTTPAPDEPKGTPQNPAPLPTEQPEAEPARPVPSFNETLESSTAIRLPDYRMQLAKDLGNLAKWEGDKITMTDPNGTRPTTAADLRAVWDAPAPKGFEALPQRDAIERWKGGSSPVAPADEFHLLRLFGRLETPATPASVWRSFTASDAFMSGLVVGAAFAIPAFVPGWAFSDEEQHAGADLPDAPKGWVVTMRVQPSGRVIDASGLRPGKPGFVYVGGIAFIVEAVERDDSNQRVSITVREA